MGASTYGFIIVLYNLCWKVSTQGVLGTENEIISGEDIADENIFSLTKNNNNNNNNDDNDNNSKNNNTVENIIIIIIIIIIEFLASKLQLGNIHLSWDAVINRIRLGGLICSLKSFLQLNMCKELQIFAAVYMYWGAS